MLPALELKNITKAFHQGGNTLPVLRGVNLVLQPGEMVALLGPSGSGKSTLLQIAGLLDSADSGEVWVAGQKVGDGKNNGNDDAQRTRQRRDKIGFVYQYHHLLPEFSALENIMLPQLIAGIRPSVAKTHARELLRKVGLAARADHRPGQLSGGEQQRVAIARALANSPALLIADEPTGNLDPETAASVYAVLRDMVAGQNMAILMATHNHEMAKQLPRSVRLQGGILAG